jgi:serine/threonine protein kinase
MAESPDHRADVWSLAVVAYEALAGVGPFEAKDVDETIQKICNFQATPLRHVMPEASEELEAIFKRAFTSRLDARFQTASSFAGTLAAALPTPARMLEPPPPIETPVPQDLDSGMSLKVPVRPRKLVPAILAGAGVGLVIAAVIFVPRFFAEHAAPDAPSATHVVPKVTNVPPPASTPSVAVVPPPPPETTSAPNVPSTTTTTTHKIVTPPATVTTTPTAAPSKSVDRSAIF